MEVDINKEMRRAVDTGKVFFGEKQSQKSVLKGNAELIVISNNVRKNVREKIKQLSHVTGVPVLDFNGNGLELGAVCGKPFNVSVMAVQKMGKSKLASAKK